jgi:hypothetical protein
LRVCVWGGPADLAQASGKCWQRAPAPSSSGFWANPRSKGVIEGDSPSFLHLVSAIRGVNDPERPEQGGWGGRFVRPDPAKSHWFDDPAGGETVWRWRAAVQQEFAERADWMRAR